MSASTTSSGRIFSFPEEKYGGPVSVRPMAAERRSRYRYPLNLSVRFRCLSEKSLFSGAGLAVNLSSGGVLVVSHHLVSEHEITVGEWAEMSIEWPSLLDGKTPLQLVAVGRVLRRGTADFAAAFERYQFRTLKGASQRPARLGGDLVELPASQRR